MGYRYVLQVDSRLVGEQGLTPEKPLDAERLELSGISEVKEVLATIRDVVNQGLAGDTEVVLDDLRIELWWAAYGHQQRREAVEKAKMTQLDRLPVDALNRARDSFRVLDLNHLRRLGQRLYEARDTKAGSVDLVKGAAEDLLIVLKDSGFLSILIDFEGDIQRTLKLETLPAIDRVLFPPDELNALAEEARTGPPVGEELARLPILPALEGHPRDWWRIAQGAGLACLNVLYGGLLVAGCGPGGLVGVFAPSGYDAINSAYAGVSRVIRGWRGQLPAGNP